MTQRQGRMGALDVSWRGRWIIHAPDEPAGEIVLAKIRARIYDLCSNPECGRPATVMVRNRLMGCLSCEDEQHAAECVEWIRAQLP